MEAAGEVVMGYIQFKDEDGNWQTFPDPEFIEYLKHQREKQEEEGFYTRCCLCNEPFPASQLVITGGSMLQGYTWACPKCHAVTQA
jgi:hypothetical protein